MESYSNNMIDLRGAARRYYDAGLNVLPANKTEKRPIGKWEQYSETRPAFDVAFPTGLKFDALCVVCGKTSGGLEIIDFDQRAIMFDDWARLLPFDLVNLLPTETTQSGGRHVAYRCDVYEGNKKLANDENRKVLIETRGAGGVCLINPTPGYEAIYGDWHNIPHITPEQRAQLWSAARACDKTPKKELEKPAMIMTAAPHDFSGDSVADYLRANLEVIRQALTRAGWVFLFCQNDFEQWQRPNQPQAGKPGGSLNIKDGYFHCFTSNAAPLDVETTYSPLQLIAALEFDGDLSAASKAYAPKRPTARKDCLDNNNAHYSQSLEMTASGVKYQRQRNETEPLTAADLRDICVKRQRARLEKETAEKNRLALNQIDVDELNAAFPIDAAPKVIKDFAVKLAAQKLPYAATVQTGLAILGGVLGAHKTSYIYDNKPIYPLLHSILIGAKGSGKTTIVQTFLGPIEREFDDRWEEYWEGEKTKLPWLESQIKKLDAELETDPDNKEKLQKKQKLEAQHYVITKGGPRIVISAESSFEALWLQAFIDKKAAFFEGKKPIGKIYAMGDASSLLKPGRSAPNNQTTSEYWARATKVMDGDEKPKLTATDWTRGVAKGYPVLLLDSQPESAYFIDDPDLLSKGFDRRLLWSFIPKRPREKTKIKIDLKAEKPALIELISRILAYKGGDIVCGYEKEYAVWYAGKVDLINNAQNDGDAELEAFISTLVDVTVHKIALILHVINHVKTGGVPDTIDAATFDAAARLADAFLDARNLTWRQMRIAVDDAKKKALKSKRGGDETATPFADLNRGTQGIYNLIRKVGEKQDCDRAASITKINATKGGNPYRSLSNRKTIDAELFAAGFMYIDPDNNKRVALPIYTIDDFSGEMIETPETNETPQEAPLDSAPNVDVSFNGIDETPRQDRGKEDTFSEFDPCAPAGPYDDDVPF